jgi:hypothetical protein
LTTAGSLRSRPSRLTVFSDDEELNGGTGSNTPWFVEDVLKHEIRRFQREPVARFTVKPGG